MSMYTVLFYWCLCLFSQTSSRFTADTDLNYILCENQGSPILPCPSTKIIIIIDAIYGRTDSKVCPDDNIISDECRLNVTSHVEYICNYNQACLPNSTNIYNDPCRNTYKYLNVTYKCIEEICLLKQHCWTGSKCDNEEQRRSCVCTSKTTKEECEYMPPDKFNRMVSFKTANKTNDITLLNLKKCMKEEIGFLKFKVRSSSNVYIQMVGSGIEKQEVKISIVINEFVIYVIYDDNGKYKTEIDNIGVSCNTCSNLAINWRDGILKLGTMFDDNLVKPVFTGIFKVRDIHLSSDADANWKLNISEPDVPNYAEVTILPNGASQTLFICTVFQNCNDQLSGKIVPVLFNKASSKCSELVKIETWCVDNVNGAELSYSCLNQVQETNVVCKDILHISACEGGDQKCDHCKYHNIEMDIKTLCVDNTERRLVLSDTSCTNLHHLLTIWHEIHDEQFESSTKLSTKFFTTSSSSPTTTEQHVSLSTTDSILTESDMNYNQETQKSEIVGLAVGISASVIVIIVISCVLIFLRKKQSLSKKESTQTSPNGQDYIGNQNIAMPWPGDSPEYTDMKLRRESHKYGELKSVNEATGDSCYDVIDANEHQGKQKVVSVDKGIFQNDLSPIPCQEYAMLDPNEKWNMEPRTSPYRDTGYDDYTVLEAEEAITSHAAYPPIDQLDKSPKTNQTKNETKMEDASAHGTTLEHYTVLDPKLTGFNRMNDTGNHRFDPNTRDMVHNTTHPLKEDMKYYELAKPLDEDGKENACHKYGGDYRLGQDSDYHKPYAGHPTYSEEHVYNHTVDDVYDTTSHNKKCTTPDNTYDYFSGDKTDDDYNIPMKM